MTKIIPLTQLATLKTIQPARVEGGRKYPRIVQLQGWPWCVDREGNGKVLLMQAGPNQFAPSTVTK